MLQSTSVGTDIRSHNTQSNDYHRLPVTEKQLSYARQISMRTGCVLPSETQQDRQALSRWIDENRSIQSVSKFANYRHPNKLRSPRGLRGTNAAMFHMSVLGTGH